MPEIPETILQPAQNLSAQSGVHPRTGAFLLVFLPIPRKGTPSINLQRFGFNDLTVGGEIVWQLTQRCDYYPRDSGNISVL